MKRKNHYKFTRKKRSKRGMLASALAAASIFALFYMVMLSFRQNGNGSVYLGSAGIFALAGGVFFFYTGGQKRQGRRYVPGNTGGVCFALNSCDGMLDCGVYGWFCNIGG